MDLRPLMGTTSLLSGRIEFETFREKHRMRPLRPYERLFPFPSGPRLLQTARTILAAGWKLRAYPPVFLNGPIPWDQPTSDNRSFSFHLHCWDPLNVLLAAYSAFGAPEFLNASITLASNWVQRYTRQPIASTFAWYDMAVGVRAYRLAYILDVMLRQDDYTYDDIHLLIESLNEHAAVLSDESIFAAHSNHGFYQAAGQLSFATRFPDLRGMESLATQGAQRLHKMLAQQFTTEGVHKEHSPDYHRMVLDTLDALLYSNLIDDESIWKKRNQIEEALTWFVLPNGRLATFGDTDYRPVSRRINSSDAAQTADSAGTQLKVFSDAGYAIVRGQYSRDVDENDRGVGFYLAQISGFHSRTHKHADDLSFIWHDRGMDLLVDSGRYGYVGDSPPKDSDLFRQGFWYSDARRVYVESTRAHNTVEIDERSFQRRGVRPYGSALRRSAVIDGIAVVESEVYQFRTVRHARVLLYRPSEWLIVYDWLWDNLKSPHQFRQWFHFAPELEVNATHDQLKIPLPQTDDNLFVVSLLGNSRLLQPVKGQEEPELQGWYSPKEKELIPNWAVAWERNDVSSHTFATLFTFGTSVESDRAFGSANSSGRQARFRWRDESTIHTVRLNRSQSGDMAVQWQQHPKK